MIVKICEIAQFTRATPGSSLVLKYETQICVGEQTLIDVRTGGAVNAYLILSHTLRTYKHTLYRCRLCCRKTHQAVKT